MMIIHLNGLFLFKVTAVYEGQELLKLGFVENTCSERFQLFLFNNTVDSGCKLNIVRKFKLVLLKDRAVARFKRWNVLVQVVALNSILENSTFFNKVEDSNVNLEVSNILGMDKINKFTHFTCIKNELCILKVYN